MLLFLLVKGNLLGMLGVSNIGPELGISREKARTHNLRRPSTVRLTLPLHGLESIDHLKICTLGIFLACYSADLT